MISFGIPGLAPLAGRDEPFYLTASALTRLRRPLPAGEEIAHASSLR